MYQLGFCLQKASVYILKQKIKMNLWKGNWCLDRFDQPIAELPKLVYHLETTATIQTGKSALHNITLEKDPVEERKIAGGSNDAADYSV